MIKVAFCDFWPGFGENNLFLSFLSKHFPIIIDDKPDYLFYSVYGNSHLKYDNCVKILYTGENMVPDFNLCDYALGFHYLEFDDRYLRFPLFAYYQWYYERLYQNGDIIFPELHTDESLIKRKFCNFIYSNNVNSDPIRDHFFHELSEYKRVDSGGRHLNNIGGPVKNKLDFVKDYKFTIAFENSSVPGYTTEKLLEPIIAKSLPIYHGNPLVFQDFVPGSFIRLEQRDDIPEIINEIITLDENDDKYLSLLKRNKFQPENNLANWENILKSFFDHIFNQPYEAAFRRSRYGFNTNYVGGLKLQAHLLDKQRRVNSLKSIIKKLFPIN